MKTIYIFQSKTLRLLSLFVGGIAVTSCGSYQNSSYYDNDGVYGSKTVSYDQQSGKETVVVIQNGSEYEKQFGEMKEDFGPTEVFTDVDNYKSTPDTIYVQESNTRYAGWGENQTSNVTVNVYDNWGWNRPYYGGWYGGWGWNSWYGNSWGWGWNSPYYNWGWGYNNYWGGYYGPYWGNGWYGGYYGNGWYGNGWYGNGWYGRNVAYNNGPRGGNIYNGGHYSNRQSATGRNNSTIGRPRENSVGTPRTISSDPRSISTPRNTTTGPRTISTPRGNSSDPRSISTPRNISTPRGNSSEPRSISTPRSNTSEPRNISTPRSSDFGGGRSSGGGSFGGGGRSSGGGGRGGR